MIEPTECLRIICEKYNINDLEKDSIVMGIRKHIEDSPGCELSIDSIAANSGTQSDKVKVVVYAMLHSGELVNKPRGDNLLHLHGRNHDGSPIKQDLCENQGFEMHGCCVDKKCTLKTCMQLPLGTTCNDCISVIRCCSLFGQNATAIHCQFFPRRHVDVRYRSTPFPTEV